MQKGFITAKTEIKNKFISSQDSQRNVSNAHESKLDSEIPDLKDADLRPLAERLRDSEKVKEEEFAEKVRLANTLRGLDQDELDFLDLMSQKKKLKDKREKEELDKELQEFKLKQERISTGSQISKSKSHKLSTIKDTKVPQVLVKRKAQEKDSRAQKKIVEYSDSDS